MKLKPFVITERIILGLENGDQRHVLKQLVAPMAAAGNILADEEQFLDDLIAREEEVTTVMENGVAFPHARSAVVNRLCLTIGVADEENAVTFNPESDMTSRLFFCIAVPAFAPTAHIPILQSLATYARDLKRVERLLKSKTPSQVVKKLATFKG